MAPPPGMMMNNPYYSPMMASYSMQMRNDPNQKNDEKGKKDRPPYQPIFYPPWGNNPYIMPPPGAMMCPPDGNN